MEERPRILVVEDEQPIREGICDLLAYHGCAPTGVDNGSAGLREALTGAYRLVILDVMLPEVDGFSICRKTREALPGQAILILTARGTESDILEGFRCGCDDYVAKPFSLALLTARVEALLRRAGKPPCARLELGPIVVLTGQLVARSAEAEVALSPRDVEVLSYMMQERSRIVSRRDLLRDVWGYEQVDEIETRCVDMHIAKLRRKLARLGAGEPPIETVRGAGYRLSEAPR